MLAACNGTGVKYVRQIKMIKSDPSIKSSFTHPRSEFHATIHYESFLANIGSGTGQIKSWRKIVYLMVLRLVNITLLYDSRNRV